MPTGGKEEAMTYHILYNSLAGGGMIPTPLQIDGETIPDVTSYRALAYSDVPAATAACGA